MGLIHVTASLKALGQTNGPYEAQFLVDTGATDSRAPSVELRRIGVQPVGRMAYELANGTVQEYPFGLVEIRFMGEWHCRAAMGFCGHRVTVRAGFAG